MKEFFPLFFKKRELQEPLKITIELDVVHPNPDKGFFSGKTSFSLDDLPVLKKRSFEDETLSEGELFTFEIHYSVERSSLEREVSSAICVDNRAIEYDLLSVDAIPLEYQLRFIFVSDYFIGKTNSSRQNLVFPDEAKAKNLKAKLREEVSKIIDEEIPTIKEDNQKVRKELNEKYPHLMGYFPQMSVGLIQRTISLREAQEKFFNDQRSILECEDLNNDQYEKALELSARTLAEYVMYRTRIIAKLKDMTPENHERELHELILPMRKTFRKEASEDDIYNNNVWMLDDRFMTYNTILSDEKMKVVIKEISLEKVDDDSRPDITLVFSGNPNENEKVSVVLVELKKHGLKLAKNEEVISQLRQRARKLLKYFPDKIERIWFYGITDIDDEFRISLKEDGYKELFSHGQMFFKPQNIIVEDEDNPFTVDLFVMTYESLVEDAESRNSTFLNVLKSTIRKSVESKK